MKRIIAVFLTVLTVCCLFTGCDPYDAHDLRDSQERYYSGNYSRKDEIMVEGFNKWKAEQNKYSD